VDAPVNALNSVCAPPSREATISVFPVILYVCESPSQGARPYVLPPLLLRSHALRYAFITHLLKKGVSPSIIARITGHTSLNYILHYTETKTAEDILSSAL